MKRFQVDVVSVRLLGVWILAAVILSGCGHRGSYLIDRNAEGDVARGELDLGNIPRAPVPDSYIIGYGDALDIQFLYNDEFSMINVKVRPDGRISYPYVGEMRVAGMTTTMLDSLLTDRFSEIIRDPDITVMIREFQKSFVYVIGEVQRPGGYSFEQGGSLMRALAVSGGPNAQSKKNSVLIIRRVAPDRIVGMQIDLHELLDGHNFALDIPLEPFDIVYVPKNWISRIEDYVEQLHNILVRPMDVYLKGWQVQGIRVYYEFYERANRPVVTP